jgi:3-oxoacyl-(acyl-carrier-protein) synthase
MQSDEILARHSRRPSRIGRSEQWDTASWPTHLAGEIPDFNPRALVDDRKLHKLIRRTDSWAVRGGRAIEQAGIVAQRDRLPHAEAATYSDRTGVIVGSGGGNFENQYDYFPLLTRRTATSRRSAASSAARSIRCGCCARCPTTCSATSASNMGLKGTNACITSHSIGGLLAVIEAMEALRAAKRTRVVAVGHETPIEPQMVLYYYRMGLLASETLRPFDVARDGSQFGEGAGALVLETEASARAACGRCWAKCWAAVRDRRPGAACHSRRRRRAGARDRAGAGRRGIAGG